jgi:hypothetical protein
MNLSVSNKINNGYVVSLLCFLFILIVLSDRFWFRSPTQLLESKQDEVLDDMNGAMERLGDVATSISVELGTHNEFASFPFFSSSLFA